MKPNIKKLEQKLAADEKELTLKNANLDKLRKEIEEIKNANKPKSITERVKTFEDVLKIAKPTKEELALIGYKGKSERMIFAKRILKLSLVSEVLNEGHVFKTGEFRYYPRFVVSGFVFGNADYGGTDTDTASASRFALKNSDLVEHIGVYFNKEYKEALMM